MAKNAAQETKGETKEETGKLVGKEDLKQRGRLEREHAVERELDEEVREGYNPDDLDHEHTAEGDLPAPDFNEDSTRSVDEVTAPDGHST
jgi:uncharacterized protein YjbJ (UPF0337 family)